MTTCIITVQQATIQNVEEFIFTFQLSSSYCFTKYTTSYSFNICIAFKFTKCLLPQIFSTNNLFTAEKHLNSETLEFTNCL